MLKKVLMMLTASFLVLTCIAIMTSCSPYGETLYDSSNTVSPTSENEQGAPEAVMLAYTKAADLGYDGTLNEFLALCEGEDGKDGIGISDVYLKNGDMFVVLSDETEIPLGHVVGPTGENGTDGKNGSDGIGIAKTEIDENGNLVIYYTNAPDKAVILGRVVGEDGLDGKDGDHGKDGKDGENGKDGVDGKDGVGIAKTEIDENGNLVIYYTDNPQTGVILGMVTKSEEAHEWSEWTVLIEAVCKNGLKARECLLCGETETKMIPADGHDFVYYSSQSPTCTEVGWDSYKECRRCGESTYAEIPAMKHDCQWITMQEPSCTESGYRINKCLHSGCTYVAEKEYPSAHGHKFVNFECIHCGCSAIVDYENPVLFHTPILDGVLDEEYLLSYHFDNPQYSEYYVFDADGAGIYDAWTNRATVYTLWDGEYVYFAVELFDDDMLARSKAYTEWADEQNDVNPYYNDCAEVWYCFELMEPASGTDVRMLGYDAYGVGDRPFSAVSEGICSEHFLESDAAAQAYPKYDSEDEQGYVDRAVIEFKIPAKMESGAELMAEDFICFALQVNDIAEMTEEEVKEAYEKRPSNFPADFDPENPVFVDEEGVRSGYSHTYTRSRTQFPSDGEINGYAKATLTEIRPSDIS